ncbi:MAG: hypothetical protein U0871_01420 [Gemmataceae bacterium]
MIPTALPEFLQPATRPAAEPADRAAFIARRRQALRALTEGFPGEEQDVEAAADTVATLTRQLSAAQAAHREAINRLYRAKSEHELTRDRAERQLRSTLPPEFQAVQRWIDAEDYRLQQYCSGTSRYTESRLAFTAGVRRAITESRHELEQSVLTCAELSDFKPVFESATGRIQVAWEAT